MIRIKLSRVLMRCWIISMRWSAYDEMVVRTMSGGISCCSTSIVALDSYFAGSANVRVTATARTPSRAPKNAPRRRLKIVQYSPRSIGSPRCEAAPLEASFIRGNPCSRLRQTHAHRSGIVDARKCLPRADCDLEMRERFLVVAAIHQDFRVVVLQ